MGKCRFRGSSGAVRACSTGLQSVAHDRRCRFTFLFTHIALREIILRMAKKKNPAAVALGKLGGEARRRVCPTKNAQTSQGRQLQHATRNSPRPSDGGLRCSRSKLVNKSGNVNERSSDPKMRIPRQQTGQLFQRHGGWYVRFYEDRVIDGTVKRVRISKRLGDAERSRSKKAPKEIEKAAKELVEPTNDPQIASALVLRVGDFVENVYLPRIELHKRPSTVKGYRHIWRIHLKPRLWGCVDKDVPASRQGWLDSDRPTRPSREAHATTHQVPSLSAIFKLAKQQGYFVGENPVRDSLLQQMRRLQPSRTHIAGRDSNDYRHAARARSDHLCDGGVHRLEAWGDSGTEVGRLPRRYDSG